MKPVHGILDQLVTAPAPEISSLVAGSDIFGPRKLGLGLRWPQIPFEGSGVPNMAEATPACLPRIQLLRGLPLGQ